MKTTIRHIVTLVALVVYTASTLLIESSRVDRMPIIGDGQIAVSSHSDADHCQHPDLSRIDESEGSISSSSRSHLLPAAMILTEPDTSSEVAALTTPHLVSALHYHHPFHRGPPLFS